MTMREGYMGMGYTWGDASVSYPDWQGHRAVRPDHDATDAQRDHGRTR
jgi:hypothetical protein